MKAVPNVQMGLNKDNKKSLAHFSKRQYACSKRFLYDEIR